MDTQKYLESYGWIPGTALQKGGLKKPILVSHKYDLKGVGNTSKESVAWWETVFDGQLKSLDVNTGFVFDKQLKTKVEQEELKKNSPLYQMFVKGATLVGSKEVESIKSIPDGPKMPSDSQLVFFDSDSDSDSESKASRKARKAAKATKKASKAAKKAAKAAKKEARKAKKDKKAAKKAKKTSKKVKTAKSGETTKKSLQD